MNESNDKVVTKGIEWPRAFVLNRIRKEEKIKFYEFMFETRKKEKMLVFLEEMSERLEKTKD